MSAHICSCSFIMFLCRSAAFDSIQICISFVTFCATLSGNDNDKCAKRCLFVYMCFISNTISCCNVAWNWHLAGQFPGKRERKCFECSLPVSFYARIQAGTTSQCKFLFLFASSWKMACRNHRAGQCTNPPSLPVNLDERKIETYNTYWFVTYRLNHLSVSAHLTGMVRSKADR